jgi:hypothetical protein
MGYIVPQVPIRQVAAQRRSTKQIIQPRMA